MLNFRIPFEREHTNDNEAGEWLVEWMNTVQFSEARILCWNCYYRRRIHVGFRMGLRARSRSGAHKTLQKVDSFTLFAHWLYLTRNISWTWEIDHVNTEYTNRHVRNVNRSPKLSLSLSLSLMAGQFYRREALHGIKDVYWPDDLSNVDWNELTLILCSLLSHFSFLSFCFLKPDYIIL